MEQYFTDGQVVALGPLERVTIKRFIGMNGKMEEYEAEYRKEKKILRFCADKSLFPWNDQEDKEGAKSAWITSLKGINARLKDSGITLEVPGRVTELEKGILCLGKAIPENYWSFADYAEERKYKKDGANMTVRFADFPAVLEAAWKLVKLMGAMFEEKLFYPEDLKKNLYFHAKTGEALFVDIYGMKTLGGKTETEYLQNEYRAPELVLQKQDDFTTESEYWTLAVYLYELFYHSGSPFVGHQSMEQVFLSPQEEYQWMAESGIFTMEENKCTNRPVHGIQDRLVKYWEVYPEPLREAFVRTFVDGKEDFAQRKTPLQWKMVLNRLKTEYLVCTCQNKGFSTSFMSTPQGHCQCPNCSNIFYVFESGDNRLYLSNGTKIFRWQIEQENVDDDEVVGMVVENRQRKGVFGIKNMTSLPWTGLFPDGEEKMIAPGGGIPLWRGLSVTFEEGRTWKIKGEK